MVTSRSTVLQVQRRRLAVHADVGDRPAGPDELDGELEGRGHADGLDGDVGAQAVGQSPDGLERVLRPLFTVTSAPNCLAASSRVSARSIATMWLGLNSRAPMMADRPIGPGTDDRDDVARPDVRR